MFFYLKKSYKVSLNLVKIAFIAVKLILFLSKLFKPFKKYYYFIKLKVTCFIYAYYYLKVIFYSLKYIIIILIDYIITRRVYN